MCANTLVVAAYSHSLKFPVSCPENSYEKPSPDKEIKEGSCAGSILATIDGRDFILPPYTAEDAEDTDKYPEDLDNYPVSDDRWDYDLEYYERTLRAYNEPSIRMKLSDQEMVVRFFWERSSDPLILIRVEQNSKGVFLLSKVSRLKNVIVKMFV